MIHRDDILDLLVGDIEEVNNYTHRTSSCEIANTIMSEGFYFIETLSNTTDPVCSDPVSLKYWHNIRKPYGNITMVIGIAISVYDFLYEMVKGYDHLLPDDFHVESLLTLVSPVYDENNEQYRILLPKKYVKGYFCCETGKVVKNSNYDPFFLPSQYERNFADLKRGVFFLEEA